MPGAIQEHIQCGGGTELELPHVVPRLGVPSGLGFDL